MQLHKLRIEGFKRHKNTEVLFSDASFLIGENNVGKSSVLEAIQYLLSNNKKIDSNLFYKENPDDDGVSEIVIEAEFRNLEHDSEKWRGFKGRLFPNEDDKYSYFYRKTYSKNSEVKIEAKSRKKSLKKDFVGLKSVQEFIDKKFPEHLLEGSKFKKDTKLNKTALEEFLAFFEGDCDFYDYDDSEEEWEKNPGGIAGNVISRLPKLLYIPAHDGRDDLGESKGALQEVLTELFREVREKSENYQQAQKYLNELAKEMDAEDVETDFGKMMSELNDTMKSVFSDVSMQARALLSDANDSIRPKFTITMSSNIETPVEQQGTGVIRSAVFALLRYKSKRDLDKKKHNKSEITRDLIICFEEPELYLHPNAANQLRDTIYDLAVTSNNQIICTTHSPYMIDLSRKAGQVLNYLSLVDGSISSKCFNQEKAFKTLQDKDKTYVKMLLKMDDYLSRVFFAKNVLVIEGDTEEIVLRETILAMPKEMRKNVKNNWQIIRARGKAVIISLVKYLRALGIEPYVMHDRDKATNKAEQMNEPIRKALDCDERLIVLEECIEDILGYEAASSDKPYRAYEFIQKNWIENNIYKYNNLSRKWREIVEKLFKVD